MEDIREIVYEEELTHYDNNNEFFAQMPLSPISASSLSSVRGFQGRKKNFEMQGLERRKQDEEDQILKRLKAMSPSPIQFQ